MRVDLKRRAIEIFEQVCDAPREDRARRVERLCEGDAALRAMVLGLLDADQSDESDSDLAEGLGAAIMARDLPARSVAQPPERIGQYRIIREIGRGGMGVVYEAEQANPARRVAIKLIREGLQSDEILRRFVREAQLLGQLQHPGIASVIEAGTQRVGGEEVQFFAMEYIDGPALDRHIRERSLSRREILILFERICEGVQHAHQNGVIHRDLKPSNILVRLAGTTLSPDGTGTIGDRIGQPKILDFGVARLSDPSGNGETLQTHAGQLVGTLQYMSPEQLSGDTTGVDTRSDIYAIGVMLYRALSGTTPFDLDSKPLAEAARIVREEDPKRLASADPTLRGDLEVIVQVALEKDPARRYQSAAALAEDLRRFRSNEPITARAPSTGYQLRKFASRNRGIVVGAGIGAAMLTAGIVAMSIGLLSSVRANRELSERNEQLEQVAAFQASRFADLSAQDVGTVMRRQLFDLADPDRRDGLEESLAGVSFTTAALNTLEDAVFSGDSRKINEAFADQPAVRGRLLLSLAKTLGDIGLHDAKLAVVDEALTSKQEHFGPDERATLDAAASKGNALVELGRYEEADEVLQGASERLQRLYPSTDPDVLRVRGIIGRSLFQQGRYAEALELLEPLVEETRSALGDADQLTYDLQNTLGAIYDAVGRYQDAAELFEDSVAGMTADRGADDRRTINAAINLGYTYVELGQVEAARNLANNTIEASRETLGENHTVYIRSLGLMLYVLAYESRFAEAAEFAREALEANERILGRLHITTITSLNNYADATASLGDYEAAETLYREVVVRLERSLGPSHPYYFVAMSNLASTLHRLGKDDEATALYEASFDGLRGLMGEEHPRTLSAMSSLAVQLARTGREDEAGTLYRKNYEVRRRVLGDAHSSTLAAQSNLASHMIDQGELEEAEPLALGALEGYRTLGENHIGTLWTLRVVGKLREQQGQLDEAEAHYRESFERMSEVWGEEHPDTQSTQQLLERVRDQRAAEES